MEISARNSSTKIIAVIIVSLTTLVFILGFAVAWLAVTNRALIHEQRTVVTPMTYNAPFVVSETKADNRDVLTGDLPDGYGEVKPLSGGIRLPGGFSVTPLKAWAGDQLRADRYELRNANTWGMALREQDFWKPGVRAVMFDNNAQTLMGGGRMTVTVIRFHLGDQVKIVDPQAMTEDRHIDLAYALTVYGVQGASERFAIALTGTEGGRKRMASLESTYVTLSRAKEHVQVYTDDLAGWSADARHSNAGQTAHDLLHQKSNHESDTGNRLLVTASRLDKTALGRRVLAENGLEGETMARFIAGGRKYPTPYVALPAWTRHGKEAGALLTEIRIEDDEMRVVLSDESRLRGGEDAQFAGLQASRNGQTLIADSAEAALQLAQQNPESGVVIRLHGEERLLNAARLTGGRITEPDEVARTVRSVADAEAAAKAEDPITLPPDEQQKMAEAQEKAARELARQELLPAVPGEESTRPEPLLSADEERRLRDGTARGERELDEAIQEAVADGRSIRQQVREQMLCTEWVVNVPEKDIELEKTLGGD